jgi:hypothetical protein
MRLRTASSAVSIAKVRMLLERSFRSMLVTRASKPTVDSWLKNERAPLT